jgi:hypothetical protein
VGLDPDDLEDEATYRDPLPPDDRLWRHPSEIDEQAIVDADARRSGVSRLLSSLFSRQQH